MKANGVAPGGSLAGWMAGGLAVGVAAGGGLSLARRRRICRSTRVEPWLGEHSCLGRHELVVLPIAEVAALSVEGDRGQVIVSSGLVEILGLEELRCVLAHEAAHLDHGHHRYLSLAGVVRYGFGFSPWLPEALPP